VRTGSWKLGAGTGSWPLDLEHDLITRAANGDEAAFTRLVEHHQDRVYRTAWMYVQDAALASELAHEAFVRLHGSLPAFRFGAALSTWLHRVVLNLCHDAARRRDRERRLVPLSEVDGLPSSEPGPELIAIREASDERVREAVRRLPPELREQVALRFGGGLTYAEISFALGVPLGTVCTRMQRAMAFLAADLRPTDQEEPQ
jgi:RNA polymerase sigma-70 factor, ECF subfamily